MHGVLLNLLMTEDQRRVSAEFGYRRSTAFCEAWKKDDMVEKKEESWNKAEQHGLLEQEILDGMSRFLIVKKKFDKDTLDQTNDINGEKRTKNILEHNSELNALIT